MTKKEISDLFDKYEDGYQAWRGDGVMTKGAFIEAVTEALRIHDVVGRSEQFVCEHLHRTEYAHLGKYKCEDCGKWMDKQTNCL